MRAIHALPWLRGLRPLILATVALLGCAQPAKVAAQLPAAPAIATPDLAARSTVSEVAFSPSPGDEIDLRVPDAPQFDATARVRPDGQVSFPIVGAVRAQGRMIEEIQAELRDRFDALAGVEGTREYLLHPNDEIEIKFPYQSQLNEVVRVRPDGKVQLQMIGMVDAEGLSPEELRKELVGRFARYLRKPDLAVILRTANSQSVRTSSGTGRAGMRGLKPVLMVRNFPPPLVFVGGEFLRPGAVPYRPGLTLVQAMIEAGGQLPSGDPAELVILRRGVGDSVELLDPGFTAEDMLSSPTHDVLLRPFDVVVLPKTGVAKLADKLNQYVFNLVPFLRNSSLGAVYNINTYKP